MASQIGMRWRTPQEVHDGVGDSVCGGIGCRTRQKLVKTYQALQLLNQQIAALRRERGLPDVDVLHARLSEFRKQAEAAEMEVKKLEAAAAHAAAAARSTAFAAEAGRVNQDRSSSGLKEAAARSAARADEKMVALRAARAAAAAKTVAVEEAAAAAAAVAAGAPMINLTEGHKLRRLLEQQHMLQRQCQVVQQLRTYQMHFNFEEDGEAKQVLGRSLCYILLQLLAYFCLALHL